MLVARERLTIPGPNQCLPYGIDDQTNTGQANTGQANTGQNRLICTRAVSRNRFGKSLTEFVMVVSIIATTIGGGWIAGDWFWADPQLQATSALSAGYHKPALYAMALSHDYKHCSVIGLEGLLRTYDLSTRSILDEYHMDSGEVRCLVYSPDGRYLLAGNTKGTFQLLTLNDSNSDPVLVRHHREEILCAAFMPDSKSFVTCSWDGTCACWDTESLKILWTSATPTGPIEVICVSADQKDLIAGDLKGVITIRDRATGVIRTEFSVPASPEQAGMMDRRVIAIKQIPDSNDHLMTFVGGAIEVWNLESAVCRRRFETSGCRIRSLDLSADGRTVVSGSADGEITIWDLATGTPRRSWKGHGSAVLGLVYSAENACITSIGWDGNTRFWNL